MDNRPIGLLDSGVGGLTVVREILRQLPNEEIVYIGDTQRAPYGPRSNEQITAFTWDMVNFLLSKNVKMIVFACNTATAVAIEEVRAALDIPVIGVILPGASSAIQKTINKKVGVIATQATVNSDQYRKVIQLKSSSVDVRSLACPEFVPLVESNGADSEEAQEIVAKALKPMVGKVDTLILGCTHYPLLRKLIQKEMGPDVQLIDSGSETVRDITVLLNYFDLNGEERQSLHHRFYTTGKAEDFQAIADRWLGSAKITAQHTELSAEKTILIATRNDGKTAEFKHLFEEFGYKIKNLKDYPELPDIAETGMTFEENARLKAEQIAEITGEVVIGDDSGICVAHFHTTLVAAYPGHDSLVVEADWQGRIGLTPQGENGFGYDPIFLVGTSDRTAAQLSAEEKNTASHRGQALQKLMTELPEWLEHIKK